MQSYNHRLSVRRRPRNHNQRRRIAGVLTAAIAVFRTPMASVSNDPAIPKIISIVLFTCSEI